jgi:hypothetical protein
MPLTSGGVAVISLVRDGTQIGELQKQFPNLIPFRAMRSTFGVSISGNGVP